MLECRPPERYRSGHNGADSKSDGRVKPARGFESRPLRQATSHSPRVKTGTSLPVFSHLAEINSYNLTTSVLLSPYVKEDAVFKHLLVPTDGSELSSMAVANAVGFAKESGAKITFLYAKPDYPIAFYGEGALIDPTTPEKFAQHAEAQAQQVLSRCTDKAREVGIECMSVSVTNDVPYEAIIDTAHSSGCDLIFMASHGRRGLKGLLLGSETQKVLTHSTIPVLVYR